MKRNGDKIVTKRGEKFAVDRLDWRTLKNIKQMYDIIFDEIVAAKAGGKLMIPIYCDDEGNKGENIEDAFCKTKKIVTVLIYPNYILFADERVLYQSQEEWTHCCTKDITKKGMPEDASLSFPFLLLMAS